MAANDTFIKSNIFSICLMVALVVMAMLHHGLSSQVSDLRVQVASMGSKSEFATSMQGDVTAVKEALIRIGVQDNSHLREQIQGEIANYVSKQRSKKQKDRVKKFKLAPEKAAGNIYGNPDAKIALIEYSDYDCPFCTRYHNTPKSVVDKSDGNIKWVYKHFPLDSIHPQARMQSEAAECVAKIAGNKVFWAFSDKLMNTKNAAGQVMSFASHLGIDTDKLRECMSSPEIKDLVSQQLKEAIDMGIQGTPATVVLNTETGKAVLVSGAVKEGDILKYVQEVL